MNNELGSMWKEAVVAYLKVDCYSSICLEGLRKAMKPSVRITGLSVCFCQIRMRRGIRNVAERYSFVRAVL
jgi:hypothetical protein